MEQKKSIDDIIDDYQWRLKQIPTWTREKHQVMEEFRKVLFKAPGEFFVASPNNYFELTGLGNSIVVTVPSNKRGNLGQWRNKVVRLICVESGRYTRGYIGLLTTRQPS